MRSSGAVVLRGPTLIALLVVLPSCAPSGPEDGEPSARAAFSGEGVEWIDLTYPFGEETVYWPTASPFELRGVAAGTTGAGYWYAANEFSAAEHGGTHLDAPYHFAREGSTAEEIPVSRLVGPAVVVDVSAAASADPDYRVAVSDLEEFEAEHGRIPEGAIVLLRTGWGRHWPDPERYLGTARRGQEAVPELHFPGLHPDAARWLVRNRRIDALGLDTPSIDHGPSDEFMSHRILFEAGIPAFENVADLDRLPPTGAYVVALPMKIGGGTGGPLRIVAVLPQAREGRP